MKVVFLVLSFVAVLVLIRLFAVKMQEYLRGKRFEKKREEIQKERQRNEIFSVIEEFSVEHETTNTDKVILTGSINNEKQNLDSKYIGNVYRAKNGRFVSKKQLTNV
jgi:hypothetical protein